MTKEECLAFLKALGKDKDWGIAEFPPGSGRYVFISIIQKGNKCL